jgi:hypothetical protein
MTDESNVVTAEKYLIGISTMFVHIATVFVFGIGRTATQKRMSQMSDFSLATEMAVIPLNPGSGSTNGVTRCRDNLHYSV